MPAFKADKTKIQKKLFLRVLTVLAPPLLLIIAVLGSILTVIATPTEAAAVGAVGLLVATRFQNASAMRSGGYSRADTARILFQHAFYTY